ncbi:hypothetical protein AGMMS49928_15770 [Spirochaetia bacterium]|nr:hypothetical protein AGMMS49928_15770 [Spirochaetia bacterium]
MPRRRFQIALTPPGFAFIVLALVVLIRSLSARNAYEIVLSSGALILSLILGAVGAWAARKLASLEPGWKSPLPFAAGTEEDTLVTGFSPSVPWFFRLHFKVRGRFYPGGCFEGCPFLAETSVSRGSDTAHLRIGFPLGGIFNGEASSRLRDIFGLFSFHCGVPQKWTLNIRSAPSARKRYYIKAHSGAEDRRQRTSSDEERYYMREYAPGDRFRDINWKSSERIDTLITRISPDNQEKVRRIEVYFRNFGPAGKALPSLGDLWLLDRAKARLAQFLRDVKETEASYIFLVHTAQDSREIRDQDEAEKFLDELAGLPFSPPRTEDVVGAGGSGGDLYLFSTACDAGLSAFLLSRQQPFSLFLVLDGPQGKNAGDTDFLHLKDFPAKGCIPLSRWVFPGQRKSRNIAGNRAEIEYAGLRL